MPQVTVGRSLDADTIYDLRTDMHDANGNAVILNDGESLILQNIGSGELRTFDAVAEPATIAGLFPLELAPGEDRGFSLAAGQSVFVYSPFRRGRVSVTGGL